MLLFEIGEELMTIEEYMVRHRVSYLRAIHEINAILNRAEAIRSAARAAGLGTRATTAGDTGDA